jgi:glycerophosphoryl diester phosphodiesterase
MPPRHRTAQRTLNIAHRGASAAAPPNTLAAFDVAVQLGADGIEFDVRLCADGVPVVIHNGTVDATTDGSGAVADMTLSELKRLDAGSWFDPAFAGERIPALTEVLEALGGRMLLNVELKGGSLLNDRLERAVANAIEVYDLAEHVHLSSFNPLILRRLQGHAPHLSTGLLCTSPAWLKAAIGRAVAPQGLAALHPHHTLVDEGYVHWARQHGYRIYVWTVDDPTEMRRLIRAGVDGIITNVPDVLHGVLRGSR